MGGQEDRSRPAHRQGPLRAARGRGAQGQASPGLPGRGPGRPRERPRPPAPGRRLHQGPDRDLDLPEEDQRGRRHQAPATPLGVRPLFRYLKRGERARPKGAGGGGGRLIGAVASAQGTTDFGIRPPPPLPREGYGPNGSSTGEGHACPLGPAFPWPLPPAQPRCPPGRAPPRPPWPPLAFSPLRGGGLGPAAPREAGTERSPRTRYPTPRL